MLRALHLEAQLQAVKAALAQKTASSGKVNDEHPFTPAYIGDKYSLIFVDNILETYKFFKQRVLRPLL